MAEEQRVNTFTPEEALTQVITLANGVDGVDAVIGLHEGLVYTVQSSRPEFEQKVDEYVGHINEMLTLMEKRVVDGGGKAETLIVSSRERGLLIADLGERFTAVVVGDKNVLKSMSDSVERIVGRNLLRCPACKGILDVHNYRCPVCGKSIPFTSAVCPHCGAYTPVRECPICKTPLRLKPGSVEAAEREELEAIAPRARAPRAVAVEAGGNTVLDFIVGSAATLSYFVVTIGTGIDPLRAVLAGLPAILGIWLVLFWGKKRA